MDDPTHSTKIAERPVLRKSGYVPGKPAASRPRVPMADDDEGFLKRNLAPIIISALVVAAGGYFVTHIPSGKSAPVSRPKEPGIVNITPILPTPAPKIQPTPTPKVEEKQSQIKETYVDKSTNKPPVKPAVKPAGGFGTAVRGAGPATLGASGDSPINGTGPGSGSGSGDARSWYAGEVQGRISRAELLGSTGDRGVDEALRNEVLTGLQMQEPPPAGLSSITLRINARKP